MLFRATLDKESYTKNSQKYERIATSDDSRGEEIFVERTPALRLGLEEIQSVVIEKENVYTDTQTALKELFGLKAKEPGSQQGAGFVYKATFHLAPAAAQRFNNYARQHNESLIDVRLENRRLGTPTLIGPFEGADFTMALAEKDTKRLKEIFSPLQRKVIWK